MSCGVGHRQSSDLVLLWLWCRLSAVAQIRPLAWELPYAAGAVLKSKKKKREREREKTDLHAHKACWERLWLGIKKQNTGVVECFNPPLPSLGLSARKANQGQG